MSKKHLKRIAAPKFWNIQRKDKKYTVHPVPGPHPISMSIPLLILVRDYLGLANTGREARKIINAGKIAIDGKIIKEYRIPVGLMDVISIPDLGKYYRVLKDKTKSMYLNPITPEEARIKPLKIINKKILKDKKIQLNFFDGRNKIVENDVYKTFDTVIYDTQKKTFTDHIKFEKGSIVFLVNGKKTGHIGVLDSIKQKDGNQPASIVLVAKNTKIETLKEFAFVVGKQKPMISLPEEDENAK